MKKITKYSRKGKAQKRYEGTGWIIIMAILLCILVPLCLLSEAGIEHQKVFPLSYMLYH